jgi:type II secretory pathway pseudopilin PulG
MNPKMNRKSNGAFTLVEIIGVMAIIGILGAVVAPRVIDGIREGRVTQLAQNMGNWKSATDRLVQKYQRLPLDGAVEPRLSDGSPYTDQTGATVAQPSANLSDVLAAQGLIQPLDAPFGKRIEGATRTATTATNNVSDVRRVEGNKFPCIMAVRVNANNVFTITERRDTPFNVAFLRLSDVPTQEAAAIKAKMDGPFDGAFGDQVILNAATTGTVPAGVVSAQNSAALTNGTCRISAGSGDNLYNLSIYISND